MAEGTSLWGAPMPEEVQKSQAPLEATQIESDGDRSGVELENTPNPTSADSREITVDTDGNDHHAPALAYPVVAIGASAGGLSAFREMLESLAHDTGMTFALVIHLPPNHHSRMASLMERHTRMPVLPLEDGLRPLPNHVYILLQDQIVRLEGGAFHLQEREPGRGATIINEFFRSVADDQKNLSIGVVLSGADGDGAEGLKAIKGEGGLAFVQSPESAVQSGMPRTSIQADHVDVILPPSGLALELERIGRQFQSPELQLLESGKTPDGEEQAFQRILQLLRSQSGLELRQYKPETVRRRMARRMILLRLDSLAGYHGYLQVRPDEARSLTEDILINVTRFFRDRDFWEALHMTILPTLFQDRPATKPIRVWCAGCSTGEEAYSLAITLLEYIADSGLDMPIQIFGTDASERSIERARNAVYPETIAADITPERLRRFFVKVDNGYQVTKRVRETCIFARQNLCNDPPFSHLDIVSCRNVMIYFTHPLQRQIMSTFHYALDPGGYMLLGMSEGLRDYSEAFFPLDRKHKIYSKTGANLAPEYIGPRTYRLSPANPIGRPLTEEGIQPWGDLDLQRAADRLVLARFGPPALVVDEQMNVLQSRGQTSPLIQLSPGAVSWNLGRVLRYDIANDVKTAVQRAINENIPVTASLLTLDETSGREEYRLDVLPITNQSSHPRCFLILFQADDVAEKNADQSRARRPEPLLDQDDKDQLNLQLRQDLNATRFHLQTLVEERDARNQELVSANEEIQSANEELQSTNEELETTKEELQSANEELQTVNDELQQRNISLTQTGNDLTNLLTSVNIPLLMLTSELRIRHFTPPMQKLLSVLPSDVGRPISDIRLHLSVENLEPLLHTVLETLGTHESEVQDRDGHWYLLRIRPYRTTDNKIDGLVVVLVDIDQLRRTQQGLMAARDFSRSIVESVPIPVVVLDSHCNIRLANTAFRGLTQMRNTDLRDRSLPDVFQHLWGLDGLVPELENLLTAEPGAKFTLEHESTTSDRRILLIRAQSLATEGDRVLLLVMEDTTLRRRAEQLLGQQKEALEGDVEVAARELHRTQQELRALTGHLFTVQEEERHRVARELHDDVSQRLSVLELLLKKLEPSNGEDRRQNDLKEARTLLQSLNTDIREISHRLHPAILDDLGLSTALRALVEDFGKREGMPATYVSRSLPELLPQPAVTAIYRITQEALRNVAKHAGLTHVKVILEAIGSNLRLEIRDLGAGFDQEFESSGIRQGLGMISMEERARLAHGSLVVNSAVGEGTTVIAEIPFE